LDFLQKKISQKRKRTNFQGLPPSKWYASTPLENQIPISFSPIPFYLSLLFLLSGLIFFKEKGIIYIENVKPPRGEL
jgi:hypothetical protein